MGLSDHSGRVLETINPEDVLARFVWESPWPRIVSRITDLSICCLLFGGSWAACGPHASHMVYDL